MPRALNDDYARRTICIPFAEGVCQHLNCRFSHSLIDPMRLLQLVGDIQTMSIRQTTTTDHVYLSLQYSMRNGDSASAAWSIKLSDGGRATLGGDGWNIATQPSYPVEAEGRLLCEAVKNLEMRMFGRVAPVRSLFDCATQVIPNTASHTGSLEAG